MIEKAAIEVAARVVLRQHGDDALHHAKRMAHRYSKAGDLAASGEWLQIMSVIGASKAAKDKERLPPAPQDQPAG